MDNKNLGTNVFEWKLQIDQKEMDTVYGFIRRMEQSLLLNIPIDLYQICLKYYYEYDYFDECGDTIVINEDRSIITNTKQYSGHTTYGKLSIPSFLDSYHAWKFKILQIDIIHAINIGIDDAKSLHKNEDFSTMGNDSFALCSDGDIYASYKSPDQSSRNVGKGQSYTKDDIIEMHLDLSKATLTFIKNGDMDDVSVIDNITKSVSLYYKMAVEMYTLDKVELLKYTNVKSNNKICTI